jgi:hypothetical protein
MSGPVSKLDRALQAMGDLPAPPPSAALEAIVSSAAPVPRRRPGRTLALVVVGSLAVLVVHLHGFGLRRDLSALPTWWFWSMAAAWLAAYLTPLAVALLPRRGSMLVSPRAARGAAVGIPILGIAMTLWLRIDAPPATVIPDTLHAAISRAEWCLVTGLEMSAIPFALGILALRRAPQPLNVRWIGAAMGAASGTLSALMLHAHCWFGGAFHTAVSHAGQAALGAVIGALLVPRLMSRNPGAPDA